MLYDVKYFSESGNYSADSAICAMLLPDMPRLPLYELSCIVFFLIPMLIILVVYTRMGLKIKSSTKKTLGPIHGFVHGNSRQTQSRKSIIRMLSMTLLFLLFFFSNNIIIIIKELAKKLIYKFGLKIEISVFLRW